ncbi:MAG: hypothetical protein U1F66_10625 [bacterium]
MKLQSHNKATPQPKPSPLPLAIATDGRPPDPPLTAPIVSGLLQRASRGLTRLESGRTGDAWDVLEAPQFHAKNQTLNGLLQQVNRSVGAAAFTVNVASNALGHLLLDLPAWAEERVIQAGGPSFDELAVAAQTATPGMPVDDLLCYGAARWTELSRAARFRILRPAISATEEGLNHVVERHLA